MNVTLAPGILEKVLTHARQCLPEEGCGIIAGTNGVADRFIPIRNAMASDRSYEMDPAELISAFRSLRESGETMLAIYHSHPRAAAKPSLHDIQRAHYPEAAQVIVSLENADKPDIRAFRILDGEAVEIGLHVIV
jgi:[CysO sulfur-carrier protein]-S-L-cysteine hydrolase